MTSTKAKVPAYEALESNLDHLEELAERCVRLLNGCVDGYVSGRDIDITPEEPLCQVENAAVIHRLNTRVDSITLKLRAIKYSAEMLDQDLPHRITGKVTHAPDAAVSTQSEPGCLSSESPQ